MTKEDYDIEVAKEYTTLQERIATIEKENKVLAQNLEDTEIVNKALEKENAELEAQIEKMKCCGNCTKGNCVNIGQKGKACAYWTSNELRR